MRLKVPRHPNETGAEALVRATLHPAIHASDTLTRFDKATEGLDLAALVNELDAQCERASSGDLAGLATDLLVSQSITLDSIFHRLARMATANMERPDHFAMLLKLAIRAQSAGRASLESLSAIQNPRAVAFVRQANIAGGPQQVNNGLPPPSRARELEIPQSKLLAQEVRDGARLDLGAKASTGGGDSSVAAVAALDRTSHARGQGEGGAQPVQGRKASRAPQTGAPSPRASKANGGLGGAQ